MAVLSKQIVILAKNLPFLILDVIFTFNLSVSYLQLLNCGCCQLGYQLKLKFEQKNIQWNHVIKIPFYDFIIMGSGSAVVIACGREFHPSRFSSLLVAYLLLFREEYDFSCFLRIPTFHFAKFDLFTGAISANHKHSSPWIQGHRFVLAIRGKSFLHSRIRYYANSDSCFQQTRLLLSGLVPSNPGPVTNAFKCSVCSKTVARNHRAVNCD